MEYVKGEVCGIGNCRVTQYYLQDGLWYCRAGHQREGRFQIEKDDDDFGPSGQKSRRRKEESEREAEIYHGHQGFELFLQCYQLILWKQTQWLVKEQSLPAELMTIVRDLWALRLQKLNPRVTDPFASDSQQAYYSSASHGSNMSQSTGPKGTSRAEEERSPRLVDTLGLCYLGALLLRLPLSLGDLYHWARREEIIYFRALRFVPMEMRAHLPPHYLEALDTITILKPDDLHHRVLRLTLFYDRVYCMKFPPLNTPLLLFRSIKRLALPLSVYSAAHTLSTTINCDLEYITSATSHRHVNYPEVQLMSLVVIAVKLSQDFDAGGEGDNGSTGIDWTIWRKTMSDSSRTVQNNQSLPKGSEVDVTEDSVFQLSNEQLDQYMAWYDRTWVADTITKVPRDILEIFRDDRYVTAPLSLGETSNDAEAVNVRLRKVVSNFQQQDTTPAGPPATVTTSDEAKCQRGRSYKQYKRAGDLTAVARPFYEAAAKTIGVKLDTLVRGVFQMEIKLQNWARAEGQTERTPRPKQSISGVSDSEAVVR